MGSFQENPSCYIDHDNLQEKPMEFHSCLMFFHLFFACFVEGRWCRYGILMDVGWTAPVTSPATSHHGPVATHQNGHATCGGSLNGLINSAPPGAATGHQTWLPGTSACSKEPGTLFPTFQQTVPFFRGNLIWLYWPWFMTGAEPTLPNIRRTGCLQAKSPMYSPYLPLLPWSCLKCGLHSLHCWVDIQILII